MRRFSTLSLRRGLALASAALVLSAAPALAQNYDQVAPQEPKAQTPGTVSLPAQKPAAPSAANKQLLPALRGLRLVSNIDQIVRKGASTTGITVGPDLPLLQSQAIRNALAAFLGKPLRSHDLTRISQTILDWYRAHDLPVVDVAFPEQDINSGTLQAVVSVYRLGQVKISGNQWFSSDVLKREMQLQPGETLDFGTLKSDLNRLNRNPFRRVDAVLERSGTPGDTNVALHVQDRMPLRVYASYDNDGVPTTGRDRYSVGFNWGNVFGLDQQFSYQFITSPDLWRSRNRGPGHSNAPRFAAHSASYVAPLPWGDAITAFGTYVTQVPNLGPNFDQTGHSLQLSLRYQKELPAIGAFSQQLQFGFDYKRSNNNLSFGGTDIFASATNVEQFLLIYGATLQDGWGQTAVTNNLVFSPGALSHGNRTAAFVASGVNGAKAGYVYDNLQITRVTTLPWKLTSVVKLSAQMSSAELLPSEQLGAGGYGSVRGYDTRDANGSQGVLASVELRSPSYSPLKHMGATVHDSGQVLVFYDAGYVANLHAQTGLPRNATLQSVGAGVRYGICRYLDARFDYGWQLNKAPGATTRGQMATVSVTMAY